MHVARYVNRNITARGDGTLPTPRTRATTGRAASCPPITTPTAVPTRTPTRCAAADPSAHEECVAANAKLIDTCREMIVAAYVAATKLQAAMRGRAERAAAGGKKGKGKKGKK